MSTNFPPNGYNNPYFKKPGVGSTSDEDPNPSTSEQQPEATSTEETTAQAASTPASNPDAYFAAAAAAAAQNPTVASTKAATQQAGLAERGAQYAQSFSMFENNFNSAVSGLNLSPGAQAALFSAVADKLNPPLTINT